MKFGVREICDVVLKAKANQKVGNKIFYKNEPVIYFDTLKTSSMEGAATTVYAQGGRGNSRLVAWEGERTVTFTMEDALISPAGFMILSGAGLTEAGDEGETIKVHTTDQTNDVYVDKTSSTVQIGLKDLPYCFDASGAQVKTATSTDGKETLSTTTLSREKGNDYIYVMLLNNGEVISEPFIPKSIKKREDTDQVKGEFVLTLDSNDDLGVKTDETDKNKWKAGFATGAVVLVDYYVEKTTGAQQIDITPDKFGGNYYLEASTLFRTPDGVDMPAEFIIPNCKIQSNFTFTMASSGDPSTFTFTMDAFPDYTRFNSTKKVLAAIQIIDDTVGGETLYRGLTATTRTEDDNGYIVGKNPEYPTKA